MCVFLSLILEACVLCHHKNLTVTSFLTPAMRVKSIPWGSAAPFSSRSPLMGRLTPFPHSLCGQFWGNFLSGVNDILCLSQTAADGCCHSDNNEVKCKYHCHLEKKRVQITGTQLHILRRDKGKPELPCEVCVSE